MPTNRIQIKRSTANSVVTGLNPGELAFTANGNILYIGNPADGASVRIAGLQSPGTLIANQALVANATSAIDKVILNQLEFTGTGQRITANGGIGNAGEVLISGGSGNTYWAPVTALSGSVNTNFAYTWNNTHTFALGINIGNSTILTVTNTAITYVGNTTTLPTVSISNTGAINIGNSSTTQTTSQLLLANSAGNSSLTPTTLKVGGSLNVNATQIVVGTSTGINANGSIGSSGQVLTSNGTTVYWTNPQVGDITAVNAGAGLLNGGTTGDVTIDVGAGNGISVSADAVAINLGTNSGLVSNTSGLFVNPGSTLTVNSSGVHVNTTLSITDLSLSGNLTINGTLTTVDTTNLTVKDSIIELANGNQTTDTLDIGFYGQYGASGAKYTGLFRDATDGEYKLYTGSTVEPGTTVDIVASGYSTAVLNSFLRSGGFVSNGTNVTITANSTLAVSVTANTMKLSGRANNDVLFTTGDGTVTGLALGTSGLVLQSNGTALVYDWLDGGTF